MVRCAKEESNGRTLSVAIVHVRWKYFGKYYFGLLLMCLYCTRVCSSGTASWCNIFSTLLLYRVAYFRRVTFRRLSVPSLPVIATVQHRSVVACAFLRALRVSSLRHNNTTLQGTVYYCIRMCIACVASDLRASGIAASQRCIIILQTL